MIIAMAAQRYRLSVPRLLAWLKPRISLTADCAIALTPVARLSHLATQVPSGVV